MILVIRLVPRTSPKIIGWYHADILLSLVRVASVTSICCLYVLPKYFKDNIIVIILAVPSAGPRPEGG